MIDGIFLLLGSNLGDKKKNLSKAKREIEQRIGQINKVSSIYYSAPWGKSDQPPFLNQVIRIDTNEGPTELLDLIHSIEKYMGRVRLEKWGERLIDIDILYYNHLIIQTQDLSIPHPGIPDRRFTLVPLVEIAPQFVNPLLSKTNSELLDACQDLLEVEIISPS